METHRHSGISGAQYRVLRLLRDGKPFTLWHLHNDQDVIADLLRLGFLLEVAGDYAVTRQGMLAIMLYEALLLLEAIYAPGDSSL